MLIQQHCDRVNSRLTVDPDLINKFAILAVHNILKTHPYVALQRVWPISRALIASPALTHTATQCPSFRQSICTWTVVIVVNIFLVWFLLPPTPNIMKISSNDTQRTSFSRRNNKHYVVFPPRYDSRFRVDVKTVRGNRRKFPIHLFLSLSRICL